MVFFEEFEQLIKHLLLNFGICFSPLVFLLAQWLWLINCFFKA